jgi:hypothetical protein
LKWLSVRFVGIAPRYTILEHADGNSEAVQPLSDLDTFFLPCESSIGTAWTNDDSASVRQLG